MFEKDTGPSADDFHPDAWDELCMARIKYNANQDKRLWYAALRAHCAYTGGHYAKFYAMAQVVDEWLAQHPSWRGRYM